MSYRITLNMPPVVECDSPAEVFALVDLAMERRGEQPALAGWDESGQGSPAITTESTQPKRIESQPEKPKPVTRAPRAPKKPADESQPPKASETKAVTRYLKDSSVSKRIKEIADACELPISVVQHVVAGTEFEQHGKGRYRLAGSDGAAAKPTSPAPADDDDWGDPEPPRRQQQATPKPASPDLAEKIRKAIATHGNISIPTIALAVDASGMQVKETLRSRSDLFKLNPRAGGWELV